MIDFFTKEEGDRVIAAIRIAETNTSGEIRVHIEAKCKGDILKQAQKTFKKLGMQKTAARNGVLFFIAPERRGFAIVGDEGIDAVVPENFWDDVKNILQQNFRAAKFEQGITEGITLVGEKLKAHFPYQKDDVNELPDDISYGN